MILTSEQIEILSGHLSLAHHIKGRVRFKVNPKIQQYANEFDLSIVSSLDKKIKGVKSVNINKLAKSITIEYDPSIISEEFWSDLVDSRDYVRLSEQFKNLLKEEK